jgi:hypothetical protein
VTQSAPDLGGASPEGSFLDAFKEERSTTFAPLERKNNLILRSQYTVSNLLAFTGPGQVGDKEQFKKEVLQTRERLRTISMRTINPRSLFLRTWDSITVLALLFTAFVTPFEVSFFVEALGDGGFESAPINFVCNRLVDAIFIFDVRMQRLEPWTRPAPLRSLVVCVRALVWTDRRQFLLAVPCAPLRGRHDGLR